MINPWNEASMPTQQPFGRPAWMTDDIEKALKDRQLPLDKDGMLMLHKHAKDMFDHYKELEMEYRKVCASILVPEPQKNEGMNNVDLGNGYTAKVGIKFNYKLDTDNKKIWNTLDAIAKIGNKGAFIADRLVSWSPKFLVTDYREIVEEAAAGAPEAKKILDLINSIMTIEDAAPTLEIKEPKQKKGK